MIEAEFFDCSWKALNEASFNEVPANYCLSSHQSVMETVNNSNQAWIPLIGSTVFIGLLSTMQLPLLLLLLVLATIVFIMQTQLFHTRTLAKSFWLKTYLRQESPIWEILNGSALLRWIAIAIALPLSLVTYVSVYSYDLWDCCAVAAGIYIARLIHRRISAPLDANLAEHLIELAHIRIYYWFAILAVLTALGTASIAKGAFSDYSNSTSDELATHTIETIKHPVIIVQHCVRTLYYSDLQLLRVRDINGWPYGWLIYLFFLIPNAIPAFGLVTLYAGGERLCKNWTQDD